jgi:hypothetical protein
MRNNNQQQTRTPLINPQFATGATMTDNLPNLPLSNATSPPICFLQI